MGKLRYIAALALTGLAAGCGSSSPSQAQVRACWNHAINSQAHSLTSSITNGSQSNNDQVTAASGEMLASVAGLYEANAKVPADLTTAEINTWLKATQDKCGKLQIKKEN